MVEPLEPDAVAAVRALARASRLLERASGELNLPHYRVLSAIASGEERASRVAAKIAVGKPTVSAAVDSLCQRGLLVREAAADDQRAAVLRVTGKGTELLATVETEMVRRITYLLAESEGGDALIPSLVWLGTAIDAVMDRKGQRHREGGA